MRGYFVVLAAGLVLAEAAASSGLAQASTNQASSQVSSVKLTNSDVVEMTRAGLSTDIIVAKIQGSSCSFDTSPAALGALKSAGVGQAVILAMVKSSNEAPPSEGSGRLAPSAQPETRSGAAEAVKTAAAAPSKGCMAVKPIGSHAFRNIMLAGVAGALISKQQYQVVDVVDYPARIGHKFHGNDLQTIQSSATKVVILEKHYTSEDLHKACH